MRIRSIKPEFWRSADISALEWHARLLFIGLWSYVDDNGVGVDREALIAADLFADDLSRDPRETFARVSEGLSELHSAGLIARYSVDSRDYLAIVSWKTHQRIDKPNKPRYPEPTSDYAEPRDTLATPSRHFPETPAPGTGEQGNRGTGEQGNREGGKVVREGTTAREDNNPPPPKPIIPEAWIDNPGLARCHKHATDEYPPPCGGCATAREAAEATQDARNAERRSAAATRRQTIAACDLCDETGQIVGDNGAPLAPSLACTHDEDANAELVLAASQRLIVQEKAEAERRAIAAKAAAEARARWKRDPEPEPQEVPSGPF